MKGSVVVVFDEADELCELLVARMYALGFTNVLVYKLVGFVKETIAIAYRHW